MRNEFEFWYPQDLRCSGKDLIPNHLTMSLYTHAAVWKNKPEYWTKSYFANGHVFVDDQKMSKSLGNFLTLKDACDKFSADATRIALADSGDGRFQVIVTFFVQKWRKLISRPRQQTRQF
jgi:leucyl-tRNA synthetase